MRDIHLMEIKPLDSGLLSGKRRLDVGRATFGKCHMRLISLLSWMTSVKKIQALKHENVTFKHYTFPRTLETNQREHWLSLAFKLVTVGEYT